MNHSEDELGFDEAWQAYAFALSRELAEQGLFSRAEWSAALGAKLRENPAPGNEAYYRSLLGALEMLILEKRAATPDELTAMKALWRQAYISTPHGKPVLLSTDRLA